MRIEDESLMILLTIRTFFILEELREFIAFVYAKEKDDAQFDKVKMNFNTNFFLYF